MEVSKRLEKAVDLIIRVMAGGSQLIIVYLMLSVCADVALRYFFNRPQAWISETSEYLLLYLTFLGAAWVLRGEGHVIVDILVARVGSKTRSILGVISSLIGVFVCLVISWYGSVETLYHFKRGVPSWNFQRRLFWPSSPLDRSSSCSNSCEGL